METTSPSSCFNSTPKTKHYSNSPPPPTFASESTLCFSFSFGIEAKTRLGQTKLYPKILPPCFVLVLCEVCDTERGANTILTLSCLRQSLKTSLFCAFLTIVSACIQSRPLTQGPEDFHSFWSISSFFE